MSGFKLLPLLRDLNKSGKDADTAFAVERLKNLEDFISTMDKLVVMFISLEDLKQNFWGPAKKK